MQQIIFDRQNSVARAYKRYQAHLANLMPKTVSNKPKRKIDLTPYLSRKRARKLKSLEKHLAKCSIKKPLDVLADKWHVE